MRNKREERPKQSLSCLLGTCTTAVVYVEREVAQNRRAQGLLKENAISHPSCRNDLFCTLTGSAGYYESLILPELPCCVSLYSAAQFACLLPISDSSLICPSMN